MNKRRLFGASAPRVLDRLMLVCHADGGEGGEGGEGEGAGGGGGGSAAEELLSGDPWYGKIEGDDELATYAKNKNFENGAAAFKSMRDLEQLVGSENRIALPKEGENIAEWKGWSKLGAPDPKDEKAMEAYTGVVKAEDYQLPEGMEWDADGMNAYFAKAMEARIPPAMLKPLADVMVEERINQFKAGAETDREDREGLDALKNNWGAASEQNLEYAKRAAAALFGEESSKIIGLLSLETGSADVVKAMAVAGKKMAEGALRLDTSGGEILTPEAAQRELAIINERIGKGDTLTATEMEKRDKLYTLAYPGTVA